MRSLDVGDASVWLARPSSEPVDWAALHADVRKRFPKILAALHEAEKAGEAMKKPDDIPPDEIKVRGFPYYSNVYVARAILAERERCAQVADAERIEPPLDCEEDEAYNLAIDHVIAAIRSGT